MTRRIINGMVYQEKKTNWWQRYRSRRKEIKTEKRLSRLQEDLNMLNAKGIKYNPIYEKQIVQYNKEQDFSLNILENLAWFSGNPRLLRTTFINNYYKGEINYFWSNAPINYPKVHSGLPALMAKKNATILFGGGIMNEVVIYKEHETGEMTDIPDEDKSSEVLSIIEILKDKTNFNKNISTAAVNSSWCGHAFFKLGYDLRISIYPILETTDIRQAEIIKERGITTAIIFKNDYFGKGNEVIFRHKEIYTTTDDGDALIINKLYEIKAAGIEVEVPLTKLPETAELNEEIVFNGIKGMLAFEIPNKLPNNEFPDSPYGASDYANNSTFFDGLDETVSEIFAEIRNNKSKRMIPSTMILYLHDENDENADITKFDPFATNYLKVDGDPDQNAKNEIITSTIADKQESLHSKWRIAVTTILNNAGYSPVSIGITGIESVSSSADSQEERNKATLETRAGKLEIWKPELEKILLQMLSLNYWMQTELPINQEDIPKIDVNFKNCDINVKFNDYIIPKQKDLINVWGGAKQVGVASTYTALRNIHKNWSDYQIDNEVNIIRYENGMSLDNPANLPELTGFEEDDVNNEEDDNNKNRKNDNPSKKETKVHKVLEDIIENRDN